MNAKHFLFIPALLIAGAAFAEPPEQYVDHSRFVGTKTRAEVRAELERAASEETLARGNQFVDHSNVVAGNKTRAEVMAEARAANAHTDRMYANGPAPLEMFPAASYSTQFAYSPAVPAADNGRAFASEHIIGG